jgi:hypothetical protein
MIVMTFMKTIQITCGLFLVLSFYSCSKEDTCGAEERTEIGFENYSDFLDIHNYFTSDASFLSYYYYVPSDTLTSDSTITWTLQTELRNICTADHPQIDFLVYLRNADSTAIVSGMITEDSIHQQTEDLTVYQNGKYYRSTINYALKSHYTGFATIRVSLSLRFFSKGSFDADRDYFFSNLDIVDYRIISHKPK